MPITNDFLRAIPDEYKTKRVSKKDREFSPPGLNLRPSKRGVAQAILSHFNRANHDPEYAREYERFAADERQLILAGQNEAFVERQARTSVRQRVRASETKKCARQISFRLLGFDEANISVNHPHWDVSARFGDMIHAEIDVVLQWLGISIRSEFDVESEDGSLGGRVDHLLEDAVLDVKTVGTDDFREGAWGRKVPGYIAQISAYARILGVSTGIVLLVDRGSGRMADIEWDIDYSYADTVLERAATIIDSVQNRQLAEPDVMENGKFVSECFLFCPFFSLCSQQQEDGSVQAVLDAETYEAELDG